MNTREEEVPKAGETERFAKLSALMDDALALQASEWEAFCANVESTDPEHAAMLRELLRAHADAEKKAFLERTISLESVLRDRDAMASDAAQTKREGLLLGPYRLVRKIGEGGMSSVWLAERDYGSFTRQVALKCLSGLFGNPEFRDRLLKEASILGRLSHSGIAQLLDAGLSSEGEPYIALELIEGEPITAYCDRLKLDVKARVRFVVEACEAVAFLHKNAVVHRDIKPSNVFVDKNGRVKLLDFGIAKILDEIPSDATRASSIAFTPEYAAPEQVSGGRTTTATDVYSLGVLLYKLLTGTRPYGRALSPMVFVSAVLNTQPSRPSTLFWPTGAMVPQEAKRVADERNSTVKQLHLSLRDDLDNILLKCLEKEAERRYGTVEALRADLLAHLHSRPVQARPQSVLYVLRKFASRHRGGVATGAVALAGLISAIGFGAWQARQTQLEAENTKRVLTFLQTLIAEANPSNTGVETITVLDLLKRAPEIAKKQFPENAALQYQVLKPVETILEELGSIQPLEAVQAEMVRLLEATGTSSIEEYEGMRVAYAATLTLAEKGKEAETLVEKILKRLESSRKTDTLTYSRALMAKSYALMLRYEVSEAAMFAKKSYELAATLLPPGDERRVGLASAAVGTLIGGSRIVDAGAIAKRELLPEYIERERRASVRFENKMLNATVTLDFGDVRVASLEYELLIEEGRRLYGGHHNIYVYLLSGAARANIEAGNYARAVDLLDEELSIISRGELANDASFVANAHANLAVARAHSGAVADARSSLELATSSLQGSSGENPYQRASYAVALMSRDYEAASVVLDRWEKNFPPVIPVTDLIRMRVAFEQANLFRLKGESKRALEIYEIAIPHAKTQLPPNHYQVARAELLYAKTLADANQSSKALPLADAATKRLNEALGSEHPLVLQAEFLLGEMEQKAGLASGVMRAQKAAGTYALRMKRPLRDSLVMLH
jgi:eukaryotic-like serine/threonine-protein kinase